MEDGDPLTKSQTKVSRSISTVPFFSLLYVSVPMWFVSDAVAQTATPRFELRSTREKPVAGTVEKLDFSGGMVLVAGKSVPVKDMVSLRRTDNVTPPWPKGAHAVLTNGDRVAGVPVELAGTFLRFRSNTERKEALRFPITWISVLWLVIAGIHRDGETRHDLHRASQCRSRRSSQRRHCFGNSSFS